MYSELNDPTIDNSLQELKQTLCQDRCSVYQIKINAVYRVPFRRTQVKKWTI